MIQHESRAAIAQCGAVNGLQQQWQNNSSGHANTSLSTAIQQAAGSSMKGLQLALYPGSFWLSSTKLAAASPRQCNCKQPSQPRAASTGVLILYQRKTSTALPCSWAPLGCPPGIGCFHWRPWHVPPKGQGTAAAGGSHRRSQTECPWRHPRCLRQ